MLAGCGEDLRPKVAELETSLERERNSSKALASELVEQRAKSDSHFKKEITKRVSVEAELENAKASVTELTRKLQESRMEISELNEKAERERARFERAEAAKAAEAASRATLTAQLGLTMKSGDTKPVSNTKVYLTKKSVSEILAGLPITYNDGKPTDSGMGFNWSGGLGKYSVILGSFANQANKRALAAAIATADTDFNGLAVFEDIPKGDYFLICATALGGGAVLEKKVTILTSKAKVALSNSDAIE